MLIEFNLVLQSVSRKTKMLQELPSKRAQPPSHINAKLRIADRAAGVEECGWARSGATVPSRRAKDAAPLAAGKAADLVEGVGRRARRGRAASGGT